MISVHLEPVSEKKILDKVKMICTILPHNNTCMVVIKELKMEIELLAKDPRQSIRQWVYEILRTNIIKLHLTPGLAISETEIADRLKISRTPVREGFIRLVEDGLLEIYSQKGSFISLIDLEQAEEARFARRVLEKAIITQASEHFPEKNLFDLSANLELQKFCQKEKNYERMFELDNEFHRIIYHGCGKERTWLHIRKMNYNFDRLRVLASVSSKPLGYYHPGT